MHQRLKDLAEVRGHKFGTELSLRGKFEIMLHDTLFDGNRFELTYRMLINLLEMDSRISLSSRDDAMEEHPAYHALVGMGKSPDWTQIMAMHLMEDLALGRPSRIVLHLLYEILGDPDIVPHEDRGRFDKIRQHWMKWGEENGYWVPISGAK